MIKRLNKIKKFGIFYDFSWKDELPEFRKFNLIYGWNRSGKTTISRVFESCEKKCVYDQIKFDQYPVNGEFEIKSVKQKSQCFLHFEPFEASLPQQIGLRGRIRTGSQRRRRVRQRNREVSLAADRPRPRQAERYFRVGRRESPCIPKSSRN